MSECYICGKYISRGEGYRRKVQTGTSGRIYIGSRHGGSLGISYGFRTICQECAKNYDTKSSRGWIVVLFGCAGWVGCVYIALYMIPRYDFQNRWADIAIIFFLLGTTLWLSVWLLGAFINLIRNILKNLRSQEPISTENFSFTDNNSNISTNIANETNNLKESLTFKSGDLLESWILKLWNLSIFSDNVSFDQILSTAKQVPPIIGESPSQWLKRAADSLEDQQIVQFSYNNLSNNYSSESSSLKLGESIESWAKRVSIINIEEGESENEAFEKIFSIAKIISPSIDETLDCWLIRAKRILYKWNNLNPDSLESSIQDGETIDEWIGRIGPSLFSVSEGIDNMYIELKRAASYFPPQKDETASQWVERVKISTL